MLSCRVRPPGCNRGVTLVELLVVMAIMGVSAALAAPAFSAMSANYRVRSVADGILGGLNYARTEAVRRNTQVRFTLAGSGWSVAQVSPSTVLQSRPANDAAAVVTASGASSVTFLPTGLTLGGTQLQQVLVESAGSGAERRRINVFGGGLIRMCDPAIATAGDPRRC